MSPKYVLSYLTLSEILIVAYAIQVPATLVNVSPGYLRGDAHPSTTIMSLSFQWELSTVITIVMVILTWIITSTLEIMKLAQKDETIYPELIVQDKALVCGQDTSSFAVK